MIRIYFARICN